MKQLQEAGSVRWRQVNKGPARLLLRVYDMWGSDGDNANPYILKYLHVLSNPNYENVD